MAGPKNIDDLEMGLWTVNAVSRILHIDRVKVEQFIKAGVFRTEAMPGTNRSKIVGASVAAYLRGAVERPESGGSGESGYAPCELEAGRKFTQEDWLEHWRKNTNTADVVAAARERRAMAERIEAAG